MVAKKFATQHKHILEAIRTLLLKAENSAVRNMFVETTYTDEKKRKQPMFVMNRDGFSLLAMGFKGEKALRFHIEFINAFNALEAQVKSTHQLPQTYPEILQLAATQAKQLEQQQQQLEQQRHKVQFADAVSGSSRSCLIAELAKILRQNGVKMGQNRLFDWLRQSGYLCSRESYSNQPTQRAMEMGLFEVKQTAITHPNRTAQVISTPKVTGKGQLYFVDKFLGKRKEA